MGLNGKSNVQGVVGESVDNAMSSLRDVAAANGLALDEAATTASSLTFKKPVKLFSWGSTIVVDFTATGESETTVAISSKETFAVTDWGRGARLAQRLLDGISARPA